MKIRTKFVSNSSSSSFIVYGESSIDESVEKNFKSYIHRHIDDNDVFKYNPHTQFGWEFEVFNDWMSKFDWAFLLMYYLLYDNEHTYYYDTMLEFLRSYYPEIERIETKRKKVGAILGDHVEVGCNSVLNPGTVVGRKSNISFHFSSYFTSFVIVFLTRLWPYNHISL